MMDNELVEAVHRYLDEAYRADEQGDRQPWPSELEALVGWHPPEE